MKTRTISRMVAPLLVAVAALLPNSMAAYDFEEGGIYYNIVGTDAQVTYLTTTNNGTYSGNVVIPERVTHGGVTYPVTSIGSSAFSHSSGLTDVTIPNTIESIGDHAFGYCTHLKSVVIPNSVVTMGRCTFHTCSSLTSAVIGNGVRLIDEYDFQYCGNLTSVVIGSSVEHLAIKVFFDCYKLTDVTCLAPQPPTMYAYYSFDPMVYQYGTLKVIGASMAAYMADENWGRFHAFEYKTLATRLSLNKTMMTLHGGESQQLTVSVTPADASSSVQWKIGRAHV